MHLPLLSLLSTNTHFSLTGETWGQNLLRIQCTLKILYTLDLTSKENKAENYTIP